MKNNVVLITGTTSGIGKTTALKFTSAGAYAVFILASAEASFITGESLKVDGGYTSQ